MKKGFLTVTAMLLLFGCATQHKLERLENGSLSALLALTEKSEIPELEKKELKRDTLAVRDSSGKEILIMRAIKDEDGEMVAHDVIRAAVVTARFRNVAERHGKVDLEFDITVPKEMQDSRWQLRFHPEMIMGEDKMKMEPIIVTGNLYRKAQLKGYQQYEKFLRSITADSSRFVNVGQLEIFLERNLPEIFRYKSDSAYVTDEQFSSAFGVSQKEALKHYTNSLLVQRNKRKVSMKEEMFRRLIKVPITSEGLRLDTVINNSNNDIIYRYTQTIVASRNTKKAVITLDGEIFEEDRKIYSIPKSDPLTFYISSLSSLIDNSERYLTEVISRRAEANTACYIEFASGKSEIDHKLGNNPGEIGRIKSNLSSLLNNKEYDLDSIIVTASCSPEGNYDLNKRLSASRSQSVCDYFKSYLRQCSDSIKREEGIALNLGEPETDIAPYSDKPLSYDKISFSSRSNPENWEMLDVLVREDTTLTDDESKQYERIRKLSISLDEQEYKLSRESFYPYLRKSLYPRLRIVKFDFHLHRKGMIRDTVHTTILDTVYQKGVQAIKDKDYETAVRILRPYEDFNTAVAFLAMDYNNSALSILKKQPESDKKDYLLAILYSRFGDDQKAVQHYLDACRKNRSFVSRGNLDPEISVLIARYGLNKADDSL